MRTFELEIVGTKTMLMHNNQLANPLNPLTKKLKAISGKRKKDDADHEAIAEIQFFAGLYWKDGVGLHIPPEMIEACIREGAKVSRDGSKAAIAVRVVDEVVPLEIFKKYTKAEDLYTDEYRDCRMVNIQKAKVLCIRPRFDRWAFKCTIDLDTDLMTREEFLTALSFAGKKAGIGTYRERYGKFDIKLLTEVETKITSNLIGDSI